MDDKDIMNPEIYEIKPDEWEVLEDNKNISYKLLIIRASLEKSKTTRVFNISKFREVIKNN